MNARTLAAGMVPALVVIVALAWLDAALQPEPEESCSPPCSPSRPL